MEKKAQGAELGVMVTPGGCFKRDWQGLKKKRGRYDGAKTLVSEQKRRKYKQSRSVLCGSGGFAGLGGPDKGEKRCHVIEYHF